MSDVHDKATRSYNMSRVQSKHTKPELTVRKFLYSKGFRFRLHSKLLPGTPDIVLPKYRVVIFVQGCFWHGHANCKFYKIPKTRSEWWLEKIERNVANDVRNHAELVKLGWRIIEVWGCELKGDRVEKTLENLRESIIQEK